MKSAATSGNPASKLAFGAAGLFIITCGLVLTSMIDNNTEGAGAAESAGAMIAPPAAQDAGGDVSQEIVLPADAALAPVGQPAALPVQAQQNAAAPAEQAAPVAAATPAAPAASDQAPRNTEAATPAAPAMPASQSQAAATPATAATPAAPASQTRAAATPATAATPAAPASQTQAAATPETRRSPQMTTRAQSTQPRTRMQEPRATRGTPTTLDPQMRPAYPTAPPALSESALPDAGRTDAITAPGRTSNIGANVRPPKTVAGESVDRRTVSIHDYRWHVTKVLGVQALPPGQQQVSGYTQTGPNSYEARSAISALRPVVEQGIADVLRSSPNLKGVALERRVAQRLTQLNDWEDLNLRTQENIEMLVGFDLSYMSNRIREPVFNHLLHSPMPFGDLDVVLPPEGRIRLSYTHTLDKNWTQAVHLGDGIFKIWMISNNNNGSHTGHIMGSFMVQLTPDTSIEEARRIGNRMLSNQNKNNQLYLDEAAKDILYGKTDFLDFSDMSKEDRQAVYRGKERGSLAGNTDPNRTPYN